MRVRRITISYKHQMDLLKLVVSAVILIEVNSGDSSVLHCESLLRKIFASLLAARTNKRVNLRDERNFPQAKLDSEINARFLLNKQGDLYFSLHNNSVYILSSLIKRKI